MGHLTNLHFLAAHGTLWLFFATLGERLGLPLFVTPLLVAAGALAAMGKMHLGVLLVATTVGCLVGDTIWYELGRWKGTALLGLLCRISFQPDSCVQRSQISLEKHTGLSLLYSKWVPGVGRMAQPLAGAAGISRPRFQLYNAAGSILWIAALLAGGYFSTRTVDWLGLFVITARLAVSLAIAISIILAIRSYWKRRQFLKTLCEARISPEELRRQVESGEEPVIVDLRHPLDFLAAPRTLPNAVRMNPSEVTKRWTELPANRDIVVYCTCPNEATAVKVASELRKLGISRVRPLQGGLAGWERLGFPVDRHFGDDGRPLPVVEAV